VPVNTRSPAQWAVLDAVMDFKGKYVLDAGCGYGDLISFAQDAGATVLGVEHNKEIASVARESGVDVVCKDINIFMESLRTHCDIAFCFSVLPYVPVPSTLRNLSEIADVTFIEAQLYGDGPGNFGSEDDLRETLLQYWNTVTRIGETEVKIRNTIRAIWMCEHVG
jgi:SAM-dependent methyltransferase